jgi:lipopolysaccharide transport system ATP-binding protein
VLVEVAGLSKVYESRWSLASMLGRAPGARAALSDVSFRIHRGECVGLLGGNGCGKTTLLKILAGLLEPSAGRARTSGRVASLIELGAGFDPEVSGRENVRLVGTVLGLTADELARREDAILEFSGLGAAVERPVREYSAGMFMRLAFSLATHVDADLLLIDEVLAVGDVRFRASCRERLDRFRAQGGTLVVAGHDLAPLADWCDRALLLDGGRLLADGPPRETIGTYLAQVMRAQSGETAQPLSVRVSPGALRPEQAARFELTFRLEKAVRDPSFGLVVSRDDWTCCFGADSRLDRFGLDALEAGEGSVALAVSPLQLAPGRYVVSASLRDGERVVAATLSAATFEVHGEAGAPGVFRPRVRWEDR